MHYVFRSLMIAFVVGGGIKPSTAQAWSSLGHQTIAALAKEQLSPETKAKLDLYLQGQTIEKAASWADAVKDADGWKHAKYYHYKNLPEKTDYFTDLRGLAPSKRARGDVLRALLHAEDVIVSPGSTTVDRKNALRFFIHLVGDLHQPLHIGFISDVGGNLVKMNWDGEKTNLHAVWDRSMLLTFGKKYLLPTEYYAPGDVAKALPKPTTMELAKLRQGNYLDWLNESVSFRDSAYANIKDTTVNYYKTHELTMATQMVKAGYRLAMLLEELLRDYPSKSKANLLLRNDILDVIGHENADFNIDMQLGSMMAFRFYDYYEEATPHDEDCDH